MDIMFSEDEISFFLNVVASTMRDLEVFHLTDVVIIDPDGKKMSIPSNLDVCRVVHLRERLEHYFRTKNHFDRLVLTLRDRGYLGLVKMVTFPSVEESWSGILEGGDTFLLFHIYGFEEEGTLRKGDSKK